METLVGLPFKVLSIPPMKLKKPAFLALPGPMTIYAMIMVSYFLVLGGVIYDIIIEPPSIGQVNDERGNPRPVAFLAYRVNGQYIMEGLASSFLFVIGSMGFVVMDKANGGSLPRLNRFIYLFLGLFMVIISFLLCRVFMSMKLPGYLK